MNGMKWVLVLGFSLVGAASATQDYWGLYATLMRSDLKEYCNGLPSYDDLVRYCALLKDDSLFKKIEEFDLDGVDQLLKKEPNLMKLRSAGRTPFLMVTRGLVSDVSELEQNRAKTAAIFVRFLREKDLDIHGRESMSRALPLNILFRISAAEKISEKLLLEQRYTILMSIKDALTTFFAYENLDTTLIDNDSHHSALKTLDILERYKEIGVDRYRDLLKLFLYLAPMNEKSWRSVLPKFIEMEDAQVMLQIHTKLATQSWFKQYEQYPLFYKACKKD